MCCKRWTISSSSPPCMGVRCEYLLFDGVCGPLTIYVGRVSDSKITCMYICYLPATLGLAKCRLLKKRTGAVLLVTSQSIAVAILELDSVTAHTPIQITICHSPSYI